MEESSINPIKYVVILGLIFVIIAGLFLLPLIAIKAQTNSSFSQSIAGSTICSAGLGCNQPKTSGQTGQTSQTTQSASTNILPFNLFGGGSDTGSKAGAPVLTIVNVEGDTAVYRIINGLKHSIPTTQIFYSYNLTLDMVQKVTPEELAQYPTARLFQVEGDDTKTVYYLTDNGMVRPILNDKVFYSYGDRKEDIITINQKEFNYYPRDQYIFVERPTVDREIYQITGGVKRYLTPVAVKRMNLKESEIAPINQTEFDAYPDGESIIF